MKKDEKVKLAYECSWKQDDKIWFPAFSHNGLYCYDMKEKKMNFIGKVPGENDYVFRLYASIEKCGDYLVMVPFFADEIALYYLPEKNFEKIALKKTELFEENLLAKWQCKFWTSAVYDNKVYMFGHNYPAIVKLDLDDKAVTYYEEPFWELERRKINREPYLTDLHVDGDIVYCSCGCTNAYLMFNLVSEQVKIICVESDNSGYNGIIKLENKIWLAPRVKGAIVSIDEKEKDIDLYGNYPKGFYAPAVPFHSLYYYKNNLFMIPALANMVVKMDASTGIMCEIKELTSLFGQRGERGCYSFDTTMCDSLENNKLYFFTGGTYRYYTYDLDSNELNYREYCVFSEYPRKEKIPRGLFVCQTEGVIGESRTVNLECFIDGILSEE